jgi:hypothetical protein
MKKYLLLLAFVFALSPALHAQDYAKDVQSVDAIIKALYEVISGEGGAPRNWDRFRFLFAKDARLVPTVKNADSAFNYRILTIEEYITRFSSRTNGKLAVLRKSTLPFAMSLPAMLPSLPKTGPLPTEASTAFNC